MTILLKQIFAFLQLLNSETGTNQLAAGLSLGLLLGFSPFLSIQTVLVLLLVFFFRIQLGAAFLSAFFFKFVAYLIDPIADQLGRNFLEMSALRPIYVELFNMPLVPMTRFNNSIVMGSLVIAVILLVPAFFFFRWSILKYRDQVVNKFKQTKMWKAFAATKFYNLYCTYAKLYL
ncbi:MAG: TIGR03546 family protein [Bdellovibrionaceae bacterium]|nr:TIGR03546 family protein [Pseudobdellovibrionaceae bacterium]